MKATQQSLNKTQASVENKSAQTKENEKPFEQAPSNNILKLSPPAGAGEEGGGAPPPAGKGLARGVQTSIPVVIATSDAVSKGAGTSQNVAQNFKVESLGITAQELTYLARRILERESARQAKKASEAEAKSE